MRTIGRLVEGHVVLAVLVLSAPALRAETTPDVITPIDVTYRESFAPEYGGECVEDAECGPCRLCNMGYCAERYWGNCPYGDASSCGSYHHCVTDDATCERRCEQNATVPPTAVTCATTADCPGCHHCQLGYCEAYAEYHQHQCSVSNPKSCGSYGHCEVTNVACDVTTCVFDDPDPPGAVHCSYDGECGRCHVCRWHFCERTCYACATDADCRPEDHCSLHPVPMEEPWGVCRNAQGGFSLEPPPGAQEPDVVEPEPELDATASIPDDDATAPEPEHPRGGGCALPGGPGSDRAALLLLVCGCALSLAARKRAELTGRRRGR